MGECIFFFRRPELAAEGDRGILGVPFISVPRTLIKREQRGKGRAWGEGRGGALSLEEGQHFFVSSWRHGGLSRASWEQGPAGVEPAWVSAWPHSVRACGEESQLSRETGLPGCLSGRATF